jgi:hypothetical protein
MESMLSGEKWSLRPWKKSLADQLSSWIMYIPGMNNADEKKELTSYKGIDARFVSFVQLSPVCLTFFDLFGWVL